MQASLSLPLIFVIIGIAIVSAMALLLDVLERIMNAKDDDEDRF